MGAQISRWEGAILVGKGRPIVKNRDTLSWAVQNGLADLNDLYLVWRMNLQRDLRLKGGVNNTADLLGQIP